MFYQLLSEEEALTLCALDDGYLWDSGSEEYCTVCANAHLTKGEKCKKYYYQENFLDYIRKYVCLHCTEVSMKNLHLPNFRI